MFFISLTDLVYGSLTTVSRSSREERRRPVLLYSTTSTEMEVH
jgi:hypothetical protein